MPTRETGGIVAKIDAALDEALGAAGYVSSDATSNDAMRWSPDRTPPRPAPRVDWRLGRGRWEGLPAPGLRGLSLYALPGDGSATEIITPAPCGVHRTPLPAAARRGPGVRYVAVGYTAAGDAVAAAVYDADGHLVWVDPQYAPADATPNPDDLLYEAWALIANAMGPMLAGAGQPAVSGDGLEELAQTGPEDAANSYGATWHAAACRWSDRYHAHLHAHPTPEPTP